MDIFIVIALVALSGKFSGLTIGLTGLSFSDVKRAAELGDKNAEKVLPLIEQSNLLLVTLLLGNTAVNATLSIFLGNVVGTGVVAGIAATSLILIFGEILPASLLSKHALKVGAITAPFVHVLIKVLYPITKPIAWTLDRYVGTVMETYFSRKELIHIVEAHESSVESDLDELDKQSLVGTLLLSEKKVADHMSIDVFFLEKTNLMTTELVQKIKDSGFTRIPVLFKEEVVGILNAKDLINIDLSKDISAEDLAKDRFLSVSTEDKLDNVLGRMVKKHVHLGVVKAYGRVVGVITMEDILEELLLCEIIDEFDTEEG